jgi:tetratricopeptide (TPR) repeat protein
LERLEELYRQANYRDAYELAKNLARVESWQGPRASVLAGRFAYNWGAPRLATAIHWRCGRQFPNDPSSIYYSALAYWSRFGHAHAWRKFRHVDYQQWDDTEQQADWIALIAILLGSFRDFTRADERIQQALELAPQSPWLHLQKSELLVMEDRRTEAIGWVEKALQINPTFRPAVHACGHQLSQLGRDSDAVDFLKAMSQQLQSGEVWCQLAVLATEHKQWDEAWHALEEAEKCWPLATRDSHHLKWLAAKRCTIAVFRDDLEHAVQLANQVATPYYQGVADSHSVGCAIHSPAPYDLCASYVGCYLRLLEDEGLARRDCRADLL